MGYIHSLKDTPAPLRPVIPKQVPLNFEEYKNAILGTKEVVSKSRNIVNIPEHKLRLFCEVCESVKSFYGLPITEDDDRELFTGNCNSCKQEISGEIEDLLTRSKSLAKEAELKVQQLAQEKNAEFAKSYADEFFNNLRNKLRKPR